MKNIFLLFLLGFSLSHVTYAQNVSLDLNPMGKRHYQISLNQLLQFQINAQQQEFKGFVQIVINKENEGVVAKLRSDVLSLNRGIHFSTSLIGANGSKLNMVNANTSFRGMLQNNFSFPQGKYTYCVELLNVERVPISKECSPFEKISTQDLLLIYPFNGQKVDEEYPIFNWTAVASSHLKNIVYKIKWIESKEPISKGRRNIESEREFFKIRAVPQNYLSYELNFPAFDKDNFYYWQVQALEGINVIATSDVWEFSFKQGESRSNTEINYVKVNLESYDELHVFSGNDLNFVWDNEHNVSDPNIEIISEDGSLVHSQSNFIAPLKLSSGKSFFQLDLSSFVVADEVYTLIVIDQGKEYKIKFKQTL